MRFYVVELNQSFVRVCSEMESSSSRLDLGTASNGAGIQVRQHA